jgi:Fe-S-cluster containining protein
MSRCTGHCCKRFTLPLTPEALQILAEGYKIDPHYGKYPKEEILKVADMVIYLDTSNLDPDGTPHPDGREAAYYTCKHYDQVSGNCQDYENRPMMCKQYPDYGRGAACKYKSCTMKENCGVVLEK